MVDYMPLLGTPLRTVAKIEGYFFFRIMGIVKMHCGFSVKDHGSISEIFHCHQSDFLHFLDQI